MSSDAIDWLLCTQKNQLKTNAYTSYSAQEIQVRSRLIHSYNILRLVNVCEGLTSCLPFKIDLCQLEERDGISKTISEESKMAS